MADALHVAARGAWVVAMSVYLQLGWAAVVRNCKYRYLSSWAFALHVFVVTWMALHDMSVIDSAVPERLLHVHVCTAWIVAIGAHLLLLLRHGDLFAYFDSNMHLIGPHLAVHVLPVWTTWTMARALDAGDVGWSWFVCMLYCWAFDVRAVYFHAPFNTWWLYRATVSVVFETKGPLAAVSLTRSDIAALRVAIQGRAALAVSHPATIKAAQSLLAPLFVNVQDAIRMHVHDGDSSATDFAALLDKVKNDEGERAQLVHALHTALCERLASPDTQSITFIFDILHRRITVYRA